MADWDTSKEIVTLPLQYALLSRGRNEALLAGEPGNKTVMFYKLHSFRHYSVYAYAPSEQAYESLLKYEWWDEVAMIRDNWYYCKY